MVVDTRSISSVIEGEHNAIANMANTAALLFHGMADINWCGFYLFDGTELVLGPFQGNVACIRIGLGRGVCGAAAQERRTVIVPDVEAFPDHIVCDAASRSEIVVPMLLGDRLLGVLDIDSPILDRFSQADADTLQQVVATLVSGSNW